jgi:hypothetical protein
MRGDERSERSEASHRARAETYLRRASRHEARAAALSAQRELVAARSPSDSMRYSRNRHATASLARYGDTPSPEERRAMQQQEMEHRSMELRKTGRTKKELYEHLEQAYPGLNTDEKDKLVKDLLLSGKSSFRELQSLFLQYHH